MPGPSKAVTDAPTRQSTSVRKGGLIALPLVGLGISTYLWRAKLGATEFICTGFSDCVSVNMSDYSTIGGVPVAAAGAGMYLVLLILGIMAIRGGSASLNRIVPWAYVVALAGALFSLYLTGVEAFVLRAYCIWCLVSWVIISILAMMWGRMNRGARQSA